MARRSSQHNTRGDIMVILGLILLVVGYLIGIGILVTLGWILIAIGLILIILGAVGHPVGGRPYWF
jgi:1,4-dihydroxy-2-naphthoate octaprenyltransferase